MSHKKAMDEFLRIAAIGKSNVLLLGATGTGKSRLAREIHERSARHLRPFVTVNLATLHEGTLESELFGHERGAFTGAERRRVGRLELAQGGTVFLDEIGELSSRLQARLLEFLQSKRISPVGSNLDVALDVRVIAASYRDLEKAVTKGEFREDLFHRLRVVSHCLPPLCERPEDLDSLVHSALEDLSCLHDRNILKISEGVAEQLEGYHWPGNIRELRNVLEYAVLSSMNGEITVGDLPSWFNQRRPPDQSLAADAIDSQVSSLLRLGYYKAHDEFNRSFLLRALEQNKWRVTRTAREIGMSKTTLLRRLNELGIHPNRDLKPASKAQIDESEVGSGPL